MSTTMKNKFGILKNRWFIVFTFFIGFFNGVPFFIMGVSARVKKWIWYGIVYTVPLVIMTITDGFLDEDSFIFNCVMSVYFIFWIVSMVHVFIVHKEYLLRIEAMENVKNRGGYDSLKIKKYEREYSYLNSRNRKRTSNEEKIHKEEGSYKTDEIHEKFEYGNEKREEIESVDINTGDEKSISRLPGIGIILAKRIMDIREKNGGFTSVEDLGEKLDLKPHIVERIRPYVTFNEIKENKELSKDASYGRTVDF